MQWMTRRSVDAQLTDDHPSVTVITQPNLGLISINAVSASVWNRTQRRTAPCSSPR